MEDYVAPSDSNQFFKSNPKVELSRINTVYKLVLLVLRCWIFA